MAKRVPGELREVLSFAATALPAHRCVDAAALTVAADATLAKPAAAEPSSVALAAAVLTVADATAVTVVATPQPEPFSAVAAATLALAAVD